MLPKKSMQSQDQWISKQKLKILLRWWCRDQTTSPKGWPKLFLLTGPDASCKRITKGSRIKSNIVMQFKLNTDILNLKSLFSIPDKQLKQFDSFFIILEY